MSGLDPWCPRCKGRGWYEGPWYGGFTPSIEKLPCPECNVLSKPTRAEMVFIGFCFVVFFVLLLLGALS